MAEESDQEKTESPSLQRLEKAREEGQVLQSRELGTFVVLMTGGTALWWMASGLGQTMSQIVRGGLQFDPGVARDSSFVMDQLSVQFFDAALALLPFLGMMALATVASPLLLRGWLFSTKALTPNFKRLNPMSGIKRMFSSQGLIELVKALAKAGLLGGVAVWLIWSNLGSIVSLSLESPTNAIQHMGDLIGKVFLLISGAMIFIVVIDLPYQIWSFYNKLKMTKEQLRQENKESEGDPHVKARIRAQQREMSRRRMMSEIPTADVVVTNPTHYAVALKYSEGGCATRGRQRRGRGCRTYPRDGCRAQRSHARGSAACTCPVPSHRAWRRNSGHALCSRGRSAGLCVPVASLPPGGRSVPQCTDRFAGPV
jgi:flagellar biosynthetic protein FlhB